MHVHGRCMQVGLLCGGAPGDRGSAAFRGPVRSGGHERTRAWHRHRRPRCHPPPQLPRHRRLPVAAGWPRGCDRPSELPPRMHRHAASAPPQSPAPRRGTAALAPARIRTWIIGAVRPMHCRAAGRQLRRRQTQQRWRARAGRREQTSLSVYVAFDGPLDQHFMRNPHKLFSRTIETPQVNPSNAVLLQQHLVCASVELPLVPRLDQHFFGQVRHVASPATLAPTHLSPAPPQRCPRCATPHSRPTAASRMSCPTYGTAGPQEQRQSRARCLVR